MAVNNMSIEQAYALIAELHEQATGQKVAAPVNSADFTSVAQATLAAGFEPTLNRISQVIGKTLVAVRRYDRKFRGLEYSNDRWGAIVRKINFIDRDPVADLTFSLVDGAAVDQQVVRKPEVLETRFVGSNVFMGHYTIFREQFTLAFTSASEFASFMSGLMTHISNEFEQWLEELVRMTLANFIGAKNIMDSGAGMIHLLTEYNTATGASPAYTATTIRQPANWGPFVRWAYGRISELSQKMSERSVLFQAPITGKNIIRHTPVEDQKIYILDELLGSMKAEVLSTTYNPGFLSLADVEGVGYWQDIKEPDVVDVTPSYMDTDGTVKTGAEQDLSAVIGVMFDRDAVGYNIYQDVMETAAYNAARQYQNLFHHARVRVQCDYTEKGLVLCLD